MKLLMVNPNFSGVVTIPSFGLGYIGTYIRDHTDWEVRVVESILHDTDESQALAEASNANVIGLICYTESRFQTFEFARKAKALNPEAIIVVGGPHVTSLDTHILRYYGFIDAVVRNEGEQTMLDILKGVSWERIPGLSWRSEGRIVRNPDRGFMNTIDHLRYDYDLAFPTLRTWKDTEVSQELQRLKHIPIISSRGCPYICSFCGANSQWCGTYRRTDPVALIHEIKRLIDKYDIGYFRFYDALFIGSDRNISQFCDLLEAEQLNIRFRIDIRIGTSPQILERLRKVGCEVLGFGVETGSDRILKRIKKGITRSQVQQTVRICKELGFYLIGFFMVGHPGETMDDVQQTFELFENLHNYNLQINKIHPNTAFYDELKLNGEISDDVWFNPGFGRNTAYGNEFYYCNDIFPSATFSLAQEQTIVQYSAKIFGAIQNDSQLRQNQEPVPSPPPSRKRRQKIAFVNPGRNKIWASIHPPMNIASLASLLEQAGHEVRIFDEQAGQNVEELILANKPDLLFITATTPLVPDAYKIADISRHQGIRTIMGGVHASILPEEALEHVDQVVVGEGEKAVIDIANGCRDAIVTRDIVKDLNDLPSPAWHLLDMEFYLSTRKRLPDTHLRVFQPTARIASIMAARGCPFSCVFCNNSWQKYPMRFLDASRVVQEIEHLVRNYGADTIYFAEDDFLANKRRAMEICSAIIKKKLPIRFSCQTRAKAADKEMFILMKQAGCIQVQFGLESGSQRILNYLKKNTTTVEENERAITLCQSAGIQPFATFMIGTPTETEEDIEMTRSFIRKTGLREAGILILYPYPGTEVWQWCQEQGLIPDRVDWNIFSGNAISIQANNTIPRQRLLELYNEMLAEFRYRA